jgi:hypothetical protein
MATDKLMVEDLHRAPDRRTGEGVTACGVSSSTRLASFVKKMKKGERGSDG